jgi:TIR domain
MNRQTKWDVFLSYSSRNGDIAQLIFNDLMRAGLRIWFDKEIIKGGQRLRSQIDFGLKHSATVVLLISQYSLKSRWVLNELDAAMLREISEDKTVLVPILIGKVAVEDLPEDIKGKRYIDLRGHFIKKYEIARQSLILAIVNSGTPSEAAGENIPMGDAAVRRILQFRYSDRIIGQTSPTKKRPQSELITLEKILVAYFDAIRQKSLWRAIPDGDEKFKMLRKFMKEYGDLAARELIAFVLDHNKTLQGKITEKRFILLMEYIAIFLTVQDLQKRLGPIGLNFEMLLNANESVAFRLSPLGAKITVIDKDNKRPQKRARSRA